MKIKKYFLPVLIVVLLFSLFLSWDDAFAASISPQGSSGTILYVEPGASGDCSSWANACELQAAIAAANAGDQIWVAAGTYKPTTTTDREISFDLKNGVAIYGGFAGTESSLSQRDWESHLTTLSGDIGTVGDNADNSYHVVTALGVDATTVLDGFTITAGNADAIGETSGGGLSSEESSLILSNLIFSGNSADFAGGMIIYGGGNPALTNVTFSANTATVNGGGMYIYGYEARDSKPTLIDVHFFNNTAGDRGGGLSLYRTSPTLTNFTFSANTATTTGGGIIIIASFPTLTNGTFSANTASSGGGIEVNNTSGMTLSNVTFSGNLATANYGGGIYNRNSMTLSNVTFSGNSANYGGGIYNKNSMTLTNVTFSGNTATAGGGGMWNEGSASNATLTNAILWGNTPTQIDGNPATVTYSDIQGGYPGTGNSVSDPLLGPLADNGGYSQTHALGSGSPAIDSANNASCPVVDQRGYIRPYDGDLTPGAVCDRGAYEYNATPRNFLLTVITEGNGTVSKSPDQSTYLYGDIVTLTAVPDPGVPFQGWSGDAAGTSNPLTIGITGHTNITADFIPYNPAVRYVKPGASGDCSSWANACELQTAIAAAEASDQIWVAAGTYKPTTGSDRSISFQLKTGVAIYGGFAGTESSLSQRDWESNLTTLSGDIGTQGDNADNSYHVVIGSGVDETAVLDGFTISAGNANGAGDNDEDVGGGMYNDGNSAILANLTFSANTANDLGGGMYNYRSRLSLTNVTFSANTATKGGGMYNNTASPSLSSVTFSGNEATADGGGMVNSYSSSPSLSNVTFSGNEATNGGGIYNTAGYPSLTNVTFSGNTAANNGGGIYNSSNGDFFSGKLHILALTNVTFSGNTATEGGAIYNTSTGRFTMTNAIVWGNTPDQIAGHLSAPDVEVSYSDIQGWTSGGTGNINSDPLLGALADNGGRTQTHALGADSPAIDSADYDELVCPDTDQRGYVRPYDGDTIPGAVCDMGAYEYNATPREYTLTVTIDGYGTVSKSPDQATYQYGDVVTLTAEADPGSSLASWSGAASGSNNPLTVTIADDTNVNATFTVDDYVLTVTSVGSGSVTVDPIQDTYLYGDIVTLTATPDAHWVFAGWSGSASGYANSLIITITGNTEITATFEEETFNLTVTTVGNGSVSKSPDQATYLYGDVVILTATGDPGSSFTGWSGGASGTDNPKSITITGNTSVTATFTEDDYTLTLTTVGSGSATKSPNQANYRYGDVVTLTATADTGWSFYDWTGDASGTDNPLTITIQGNTNVTARFNESGSDEYYITVTTVGDGSVTFLPDQATYQIGDEVTLTATGGPGYTFSSWSGDAVGTINPVTITITGNTSVTATFIEEDYTLTVTTVGSGDVAAVPDQATYQYGDVVTLTATADPGWSFYDWAGDATGTDNPLTITITGDTNVTARFSEPGSQHYLTVTTVGDGSVMVSPNKEIYYLGDIVTLTATGDPGSSFTGWTGDATGTDNPLTITITGDTNITATFNEGWFNFLPIIMKN